MYEVYLSIYPNGTFVEAAQLELHKLNKQKEKNENKEASDFQIKIVILLILQKPAK